jgi:hypothetical protein
MENKGSIFLVFLYKRSHLDSFFFKNNFGKNKKEMGIKGRKGRR